MVWKGLDSPVSLSAVSVCQMQPVVGVSWVTTTDCISSWPTVQLKKHELFFSWKLGNRSSSGNSDESQLWKAGQNGTRAKLQSNRNHLASACLFLSRQKPRVTQRLRPLPAARPGRPREAVGGQGLQSRRRIYPGRLAGAGSSFKQTPPTLLTQVSGGAAAPVTSGTAPRTPPGAEDPLFPRPAPPGGSFSARAGGAVPPPPPPVPPHRNGGARTPGSERRRRFPPQRLPLTGAAASNRSVCSPAPPCVSVSGEQRGWARPRVPPAQRPPGPLRQPGPRASAICVAWHRLTAPPTPRFSFPASPRRLPLLWAGRRGRRAAGSEAGRRELP